MKICEHIKSIANTNWWVSQLKRVVFLESRWREWMSFFFFLFLPFLICLFFVFSIFCNFFFCILLLVYWENQSSVSLFLSLFTFQVINMGFLNEMWDKGLIQGIFRCRIFFFFFFEKAKDLVMGLAFMSFQQTGLTFFYFFLDVKAILYNILLLLGASYKWGALGGGLMDYRFSQH